MGTTLFSTIDFIPLVTQFAYCNLLDLNPTPLDIKFNSCGNK
jgi:hypothetical protein